MPSEARHRLEPLECADEKRVPDSPSDNLDENGALEAILGELDDAMDEGPPAEPSAVHMEVASSGKVTARKEDGTRVATPSQMSASSSQTTPTLPTSLNEGTPSAPGSTLGLPTRHRSYAAATQSVPQDWHLEFSIGDQPVSSDSTIYRAVQRQFDPTDAHPSRSIWSSIHTIKIKRVPGPPPAETSASGSNPDGEGGKPAAAA